MPTTFDEDEISVSGSRPIDLYTIATPIGTYRQTSHIVDVVYAGNTYTAITMARSSLQIVQDPTGRELVITLPITHPFVQRYAASGVPPQRVTVTAMRLQSTSGAAMQFHAGFAGGMSIDAHLASLRVPLVTDDAMKISLPVLTVGKLCGHVLFDARCSPGLGFDGGDGPDIGAFAFSTTVVSQVISSNVETVLTLAGMNGNPDGWATHGQVLLLGDTEARLVLAHTGNVLTINAPFIGLNPGDGVNVHPGCAHDITTCRDKFDNRVNFGGYPTINAAQNIWVPAGLGVVQQV